MWRGRDAEMTFSLECDEGDREWSRPMTGGQALRRATA
jgi:hypothetical protein